MVVVGHMTRRREEPLTLLPPPLCLSREGDDRLKMRSVLRQLIMRPRDVAAFSDDVNEVVTDMVTRVRTLRGQQTDGSTVLNINDMFFKYAMEGRTRPSALAMGDGTLWQNKKGLYLISILHSYCLSYVYPINLYSVNLIHILYIYIHAPHLQPIYI